MKAVLTSKNKAKIMATRNVLLRLYSDLELETIEVESGVSATPTSEDEGIQGCLHRIEEAKKIIADADLYVSLEGIITENRHGTFLSGWCAIEQPQKNRTGLGSSAKVRIPDFIIKHFDPDTRLSDIVERLYPSELVKDMPELGTNGIITDKMYTRVDEFEDAIVTTIGFLQNEANFYE